VGKRPIYCVIELDKIQYGVVLKYFGSKFNSLNKFSKSKINNMPFSEHFIRNTGFNSQGYWKFFHSQVVTLNSQLFQHENIFSIIKY